MNAPDNTPACPFCYGSDLACRLPSEIDRGFVKCRSCFALTPYEHWFKRDGITEHPAVMAAQNFLATAIEIDLYGASISRLTALHEEVRNVELFTKGQHNMTGKTGKIKSAIADGTNTISLSDEERLKALGHAFIIMCDEIGSSRELSLAKTKIEEAVFWSVKHVTA